jgi:hypothetical protein
MCFWSSERDSFVHSTPAAMDPLWNGHGAEKVVTLRYPIRINLWCDFFILLLFLRRVSDEGDSPMTGLMAAGGLVDRPRYST